MATNEDLNVESTRSIWVGMIKERKGFAWSLGIAGLVFLVIFPPIGIVFFVVPLVYLYMKAHQEFMRKFAELNGMRYEEKGNAEDFRGALYKQGYNRRANNVVSGSWNNFPLKIFNFGYTTGSGKSRSEHLFTVLEISFEKLEFPSIFLKSKKMWHFMFLGNAEVPLHNKHFKLSAAKGYEIEALQIFSDELLGYLAEHAPNFSIEFAKNRINIYDDKNISNKKDLLALLDAGKHIIDSSGAFISRLSDDFAALHPYYQK